MSFLCDIIPFRLFCHGLPHTVCNAIFKFFISCLAVADIQNQNQKQKQALVKIGNRECQNFFPERITKIYEKFDLKSAHDQLVLASSLPYLCAKVEEGIALNQM